MLLSKNLRKRVKNNNLVEQRTNININNNEKTVFLEMLVNKEFAQLGSQKNDMMNFMIKSLQVASRNKNKNKNQEKSKSKNLSPKRFRKAKTIN